MSDRVVKVVLSAKVDEYSRGMDEAARKTQELASAADKLAAMHDAMNTLGVAALAMGGVFAAGVGVAIKKAADFDEAMSHIQAATHESAENMGLLREAALDAGASTVFSATEAAGAIEEMAKAGIETADIMGGGLAGSLDLAAAGGLGVAEAASISATALNMFNLEGSDMSHVADLMSAGAGKAMGDVSDLGAALNQAGLVASATGLSIEETTATLAAFASQGLLGSDAGTSFKTMLQRLTPQSAEAREEMERLGISAFDANGEFIGMSEFAGVLQSSLKGMSTEQRNTALNVMFGADAIRAANVLIDEGAAGIEAWTDKVNDQGYAAETAAMRLDNLKGDWEAFTGALDTAFITMGSGVNGPLREFVQGLTNLVDGFNDLPDWAQQLILVAGAAIALTAGIGGAALIAVPKIAAFKQALSTLNTSLGKVSLIGGGVTLAIGAIITAVSALAGAHAEAEAQAKEYAASLDANLDATAETYSKLTDKMMEAQDGWDKAFSDRWMSGAEAAEKLGMSVEDVVRIAGDGGVELRSLTRSVEDLRTNAGGAADVLAKELGVSTDDVKHAAHNLKPVLEETGGALSDARLAAAEKAEAMGDLADKTDESAEVAKTASEAYLEEAETVAALKGELDKLIETFNTANGVGQDAISQNIAYQDTLRDVDAHIAELTAGTEGYAFGLDVSTASGARNTDMLLKLAKDSQSAAAAQYGLDQNSQAYISTLEIGRQKLIASAMAMGATEAEAIALANSIYAIPSQKQIDILANTQAATGAIDSFIWNNSGRKVWIDVVSRVATPSGGSVPNYQGGLYEGGVKAFAQGGFASGIYSGVQGGIHKFAESEMGVPWEAYISGRAADRDRNIGIAFESLRRLGVNSGGGGVTNVKNVDVKVTQVNPVSRDPLADAWDTAQIVGANV